MTSATQSKAVRFRRAVPGDFATLMKLEKASFGRRRPYGTKGFHDVLEKRYGFTFVVEQGGAAVGFVIFYSGWEKDLKGCVELALMVVAPEARRQGLGKKILAWVARYGSRPTFGAGWIRLRVRESNVAARALHRQLGFEEYGIGAYPNGEPCHNLRVKIADLKKALGKHSPVRPTTRRRSPG